MSTFRTPVGPQPSSVYWRRRLVVGLALLAIIVIILLIIFQPKGGPAPTPKATQSASSSTPGPNATDAPANGQQACAPGVVDVIAATNQTSYAAGEIPQLSLTLTNKGAAACTFNAGTSQQEFLITSGAETYWNSKDCQTTPSDTPVVLQPNKPTSAPAIPWDRTRSDPSTCAGERDAAPAGGASYHLNINVGALKSNDVQFALN